MSEVQVGLRQGIAMWDELYEEIQKELKDAAFASRTHGSRATYALNCHGPLCTEAERLRGNARFESKPLPELQTRYEYIQAVIDWHRERRGLAPLSVAS